MLHPYLISLVVRRFRRVRALSGRRGVEPCRVIELYTAGCSPVVRFEAWVGRVRIKGPKVRIKGRKVRVEDRLKVGVGLCG